MHFLITAGPTREPLDPVRYLTNRSSGKMGYALAAMAAKQGYEVTLVSGPVQLQPPPHVTLIPVQTAQEMWDQTRQALDRQTIDVAILSAAVADYRPRTRQPQKIKKQAAVMTLELERTPDILGSMRQPFGFKGFLAGFAAETENLISNAQSKLRRKGCDLVIANDVSRSDAGFDSDQNEVMLCFPDGKTELLPRQPKQDLAHHLINRIATLVIARTSV